MPDLLARSRVDRVDADTVQDLRRAGCFRVWYGAESGSERVVKSMRKDFDTQRVRESIRLTKEAVQRGMELDLEHANRYEADLFALCFDSEDQKEGMRAFLEKRPPNFKHK